MGVCSKRLKPGRFCGERGGILPPRVSNPYTAFARAIKSATA